MIKNVSDLLAGFIAEEQRNVSNVDMPHMPTLGEAYEEITKHGISQKYILPPGNELKVVSGFLTIGNKQMPHQLDCMLVVGEGIKYGLTEKYIYDIDQVLAIFEVKKTLRKEDLLDAITHLGEIKEECLKFFHEKFDREELDLDISVVSKHFSYLTGKTLNSFQDIFHLSDKDKTIAMTLSFEMWAPLTIIHGYAGYTREGDLKNALQSVLELVEDANSGRGIRFIDFPNLITTNQVGVVKTVALPYFAICDYKSEEKDYNSWAYLCSYKLNAAHIIIESLWSKMGCKLGYRMPFGDDQEIEQLSPLVVFIPNTESWNFEIINKVQLPKIKSSFSEWSPIEVAKAEYDFLLMIILHGGVSLSNNIVQNFIDQSGFDRFQNLIKMSYILGFSDNSINIIASSLFLETKGKYYFSHDRDRFSVWCKKNAVSESFITNLLLT